MDSNQTLDKAMSHMLEQLKELDDLSPWRKFIAMEILKIIIGSLLFITSYAVWGSLIIYLLITLI